MSVAVNGVFLVSYAGYTLRRQRRICILHHRGIKGLTQANSSTPLAPLVLLLLDDEAEYIGAQFLALLTMVDTYIQSRAVLLRVTGAADTLTAAPVESARAQALIAAQNAQAFDPAATQKVPNSNALAIGTPRPFQDALLSALQKASHTGSTDRLASGGFSLLPNEIKLILVGEANAPLLSAAAKSAATVSAAIGPHIYVHRYAALISALPPANPAVLPSSGPNIGSETGKEWLQAAQNQPWNDLLSWRDGEPPLLYTFFFDAWDETGRYQERSELRHAASQAIFAMFAAGVLENPQMRDLLDLSAAPADSDGLLRIGSVGTSVITTPDRLLLSYIALRLSADVLLRRGLIGQKAGAISPQTHTRLKEEARRDAEMWLSHTLRAALFPDYYAIPHKLPPRKDETGAKISWSGLALSATDPDPSGIFARWEQRPALLLDDEHFWNLLAQYEVETAQASQQWIALTGKTYTDKQAELAADLENIIRWRTLGPQSAARTEAFTEALLEILNTELELIEDSRSRQSKDLEQEHIQYEAKLRRMHPRKGTPISPPPPESAIIPRLPRSSEAMARDVIARQFQRTPKPATLAVTAVALIAAAAAFAHPLGRALQRMTIAKPIAAALSGPNGALLSAGVLCLIYFLVLLLPFTQAIILRQRQQELMAQRELQWLAWVKLNERDMMYTLIKNLHADVERAKSFIAIWSKDIDYAAERLIRSAEELHADLAAAAPERKIYVTSDGIWDAYEPNELYFRVRGQAHEDELIEKFLQYIEAHSGDVLSALKQDRIGALASDFMQAQLRETIHTNLFLTWDIELAAEAINKAALAAAAPFQIQLGGRPVGKGTFISAFPEDAWVQRMAAERGAQIINGPSSQWIMVIKVISRAPHLITQYSWKK